MPSDRLPLIERFGQVLGWMIAFMVLLASITVVTRYLFNYVSIPLQEITLYLHAFAFMLGIIYAWAHDRHVRVDVFYQAWTPKRRNRVNTLGHMLLALPMLIYILYSSTPYVMRSWKGWEASATTGGLPLVWLVKTLLILMPVGMIVLIALQLLTRKKAS
ncbi:TRAP transporter small permease subunit [Marinicella sp. W31]|uniref:TRAP transporter small permease subunit n=1 Tax=Marinicella sp. W31 TaxID=3023713 RepID=UPI003756BB0A